MQQYACLREDGGQGPSIFWDITQHIQEQQRPQQHCVKSLKSHKMVASCNNYCTELLFQNKPCKVRGLFFLFISMNNFRCP